MDTRHSTLRRSAACIILLLLIAFAVAGDARAASPFERYSPEVAEQADRVVAAANGASVEAFQAEARELGRRMRRRGILSINALPDIVYAQAVQERWSDRATPHLRILTRVSPLSVPLWGILLRKDAASFNVEGVVEDAKGISGAVRSYGPALIGFVVWTGSFAAAASGWFAAWASLVLYLRVRPSLEADLQRLLASVPASSWMACLGAFLLFLLPLATGTGLAVVASFWLLLSAPYLREGEKAIKTLAVVLLMVVIVAGTVVGVANQSAGDTRKGGWLGGEGYVPDSFPEDPAGRFEGLDWMVKFSRARAAMQAGRPEEALSGFDNLVAGGRGTAEVVNNRGVALAQLGRLQEALVDFEAAGQGAKGHPPALWNAYQVYLKTFRLEKGQSVQAQAWKGIKDMSPFGYQPSEFEQGEWIASSVPVSSLWGSLIGGKYDWLQVASDAEIVRLYFHPLSPVAAAVLLIVLLSVTILWKLLGDKIWVNTTCRACGAGSLAVGSRDAAATCNLCKAMIGVGTRSGEERDRRIQTIVLHRRYVRICTFLVPGSGLLWSGKDAAALVYGIFLSAFLGLATLSSGVEGGSSTITGNMASGLTILAVGGVVVLWAIGALWGHTLYASVQNRHNLAGVRR
jgi:hypothetical protein